MKQHWDDAPKRPKCLTPRDLGDLQRPSSMSEDYLIRYRNSSAAADKSHNKPSGKVRMTTTTTTTRKTTAAKTIPPSSNPIPQAAAVAEPKVGTRKSSREKKSTLIYVDGYAIKKQNNYVVKGTQYVFHSTMDNSTQHRTRRLTKQATSKNGNPQKTISKRVISPAEARRAEMKESVESAIRDKSQTRDAFLHSHLDAFEPFIESKIYQKIKSRNAGGTTALVKTEVFMQPDAITADMRDYQLAGLNFMSNMYQNNVGMILGDGTCIEKSFVLQQGCVLLPYLTIGNVHLVLLKEMGLGKTLQTIALHCHIHEKFQATGPSLVVCPLSVLYSWCDEIKKWAPTLKYLRYHSSNPESMDGSDFHSYDMIVTTYEMVKAPALRHVWSRQHFRLLVLDEGHRIKASETQVSQAVRKIHCENRLILTGTPLANNLVELYSLLSFLAPDVFTTAIPFAEAFDLTLNMVNPKRLEQAHKLLQVFMLRRLKCEVEKLMPRKIETKVVCPLSTVQIWWYKAILLKDMNLLAREDATNRANVLNNLVMQLRKCCIHPYLFPGAEDIDSTTLEDLVGASGKLSVLDMLLCSLYKKGHRVVLFSQFTSVLDILDDYCTMRGWNYCRFDGSTARAKRNYIVNSFNAPNSDKFLFLMSTRSGGMGLNLQTADTCILCKYNSHSSCEQCVILTLFFSLTHLFVHDHQLIATGTRNLTSRRWLVYTGQSCPTGICFTTQSIELTHLSDHFFRIGQKKTVHVYRLVTQGTVEQIMCERAEKKLYLDAMVTRDGVSASDTFHDEENAGKLLETLKVSAFSKNTLYVFAVQLTRLIFRSHSLVATQCLGKA